MRAFVKGFATVHRVSSLKNDRILSKRERWIGMTNRPSIPAEIERQILIECGHRCAVCGTPAPLERAHIIPWRKTKEHKAEDLICLCANCHGRADQEKWGQKTLQEYKDRPWVMRQHDCGCQHSIPESQSIIRITIDMELKHFDEKNQRWLQSGLAAFLGTGPSSVRIQEIEQGSTRVSIELPTSSSERLLRAYKESDPELSKFIEPLMILDICRETKERERLQGFLVGTDEMRPKWETVRCLFSHKCGVQYHEIGEHVQEVFCKHAVELLIDPFEPGVGVGARIDVLDIHALLFLCCKESLRSAACQEELRVARDKLIPVFVIHWDDDVPAELSDRISVNLKTPSSDSQTELDMLGQTVLNRAGLYKQVQVLFANGPPEQARQNAQSICEEGDSTAVTEFLPLLEKAYRPELDEVARYWLALAVGKTRCARAREVLEKWASWEEHPLPQEGIREGLSMIGIGSKPIGNKKRKRKLFVVVAGLLAAVACLFWTLHKLNDINVKLIHIEELYERTSEVQRRISDGV